jgi:hypothetical protein
MSFWDGTRWADEDPIERVARAVSLPAGIAIAIIGLINGQPFAISAFVAGLYGARRRASGRPFVGVMKPPPPSVPLPGDRGSSHSLPRPPIAAWSPDSPGQNGLFGGL